jgi:outer membrane protein OmpA-like peptidoglycan-associated protein
MSSILQQSCKSIFLSLIMFTCSFADLEAQQYKYNKPTFWVGAAGGANLNYYRGSTHQLNTSFKPPVAFHNGSGAGLYLAPLLEYQSNTSGWGFMFQAGYDSRKSTFDQVISPCNCPADLSSKLNYVTVEPSIRFAPGRSNFYLFGGPRLAFNVDKSFTYKLGINPDFPNQEPTPDVSGDFSDVKKVLISMQVGAGYDIPLNSKDNHTQAILSPFVAFHPYFGQSPRSLETWNITTIRVGASLKFGIGKENPAVTNTTMQPEIVPLNKYPEVKFTINSPKNIPAQRTVSEAFPLRNYVFFDLGSTEIPDRYVLINKDQAKNFKEDQSEVFMPKNLSGRSDREIIVYYNLLNILGDRLVRNPTATIKLVGSSEKGPQEGVIMAKSVKKYIVGVFGIDTTRIAIEGTSKPKIPSEQRGGTLELGLLKEEDRRVTIESNAAALLMEFNNGNTNFLKSVKIKEVQNAPLDSYVSFHVDDKGKSLRSWSVEFKDKVGNLQNFGPYTKADARVSGKSILGTQTKGDYDITMKGIRTDGSIIEKDATSNIVLWEPTKNEEGSRFSIQYEFNKSDAIDIYEKYLSDIVVPKIPVGGKVIIHGHTDMIGDEQNNYELSLARANDVHKIMKKSLDKTGRNDVIFEVLGFGEDAVMSPFSNKYPEERFYNRAVIIDIIPNK